MKRWMTLALWALGMGCAPRSELVTQARHGEHTALAQALEPRLKAGSIGRAEVKDIARSVLERELALATDHDAIERVWEAEACVHESERWLHARSHRRDAAGALALLVLYEAGELTRSDALLRLHDTDPDFMRTGVRALDTRADHEARVGYLTHSNGLLRAAAARAALLADDPRDGPALRERARLDPEPEVRRHALRALVVQREPAADATAFFKAILDGDGGPKADAGMRQDIAIGLLLSPIYEHGGRALVLELLSDKSGGDLDERAFFALLVLRTRPTDDNGIRELAERILERALDAAKPATQQLIVSGAPKAAKRLWAKLEALAKRDGARTELGVAAHEALARPEPLLTAAGAQSELGRAATLALARMGERRVQAWLERDLEQPSPLTRLAAARGLAALDLAGRAAPLLAAQEPSVRMRAACLIVKQP